MNKDNFERAKWLPICIIAVLLMVIYKTFDNLTQITSAIGRFTRIISPLLFGVLFAYFLSVPYEKLAKLYSKAKLKFISKRCRGFSILTVFLFLLVLIAFLMAAILPRLVTSVAEFIISLPAYRDQIINYLEGLPADSILNDLNIAAALRDLLDSLINPADYAALIGQLGNPADSFALIEQLGQFTRGVISVASGLVNILLGLVISLYLLFEKDSIIRFFSRLSKAMFKNEKFRSRLHEYLGQVNKVLVTFIASKGLDSIINLIVVTSILFAFNIQYAPLLGLLAGLLNFIPYLGSLIAVFLISTITVLTSGISRAIPVLILLLIFQQLDGNFIEPRIMKTSLKISPILVILSVLVGGAYFGIVGMFLAVPIVTIVKQILLEYIGHHTKTN